MARAHWRLPVLHMGGVPGLLPREDRCGPLAWGSSNVRHLRNFSLHNGAARRNMMCCDRAEYPGRWRMRGLSPNPEVLWEIFGPEGQFEALKVRDTFVRCNDKCDV